MRGIRAVEVKGESAGGACPEISAFEMAISCHLPPMQPAPVAILGATGFIGRHLAAHLRAKGIPVTGISRAPKAQVAGISRWQTPDTLDLANHQAVVNLSGERVDCRWSPAQKQILERSRIEVTQRLVGHLRSLDPASRPAVLLNGSGIGYYGDGGDTPLDESAPAGTDYLAKLCVDWENAALEATTFDTRVVLLRTGVVLGKGGAAFDKLRKLFALGLGGNLGSGRQWMPWIHLDDEISAIIHAIETPTLHGPLNLSAPQPERNADFTRKLAAALHRPAFFHAPAFALKLALGEFANALLTGQRAVPAALTTSGFTFRHATLDSALADLLA